MAIHHAVNVTSRIFLTPGRLLSLCSQRYFFSIIKLVFLFTSLLLPLHSHANNKGVSTPSSPFQTPAIGLFYNNLYPEKHLTLYCAVKMNDGQKAEIEQVYPVSWIAEFSGCDGNLNCSSPLYKAAINDLHNMWPALSDYVERRNESLFNELSDSRLINDDDHCDFKMSTDAIEPRDYAKGEIARSVLYMIWRYNLNDYNMLNLMLKWNEFDPVSAEEMRRNDAIEGLQGNRNIFIDYPELAAIILQPSLKLTSTGFLR